MVATWLTLTTRLFRFFVSLFSRLCVLSTLSFVFRFFLFLSLSWLSFFTFFMAATVPTLKEVLSSFGDEKDVYLYIPLKKTKVTAFMLVDHLLKKGELKRYPSLVFHPLHHALHLTAAADSLASFRDRNPTINIGSTRLGVYWSQNFFFFPLPES